MRVGAIDVGTNTTRLLVAEETAGGFRTLDRRMVVTRLGQDVDRRRILSADALTRTFSVIADYAAVCGEYEVDRLRVVGTSAVRDARNREEFFTGVERLVGAAPEMLSGDAEARATFLGATSDLHVEGTVLLLDIGGGSTELVSGRSEPETVVSLDIGAVRMLEKHLDSDPPTDEEMAALRHETRTAVAAARAALDVEAGSRLVGVAGTVTQLALLKAGLPVYDPDVTHHAVLSHGDVRRLARRLASLTYAQRKRIKGMEPGRADVIVPGAEILIAVMELFDLPEVLVSEKDILDGLVLQLLTS